MIPVQNVYYMLAYAFKALNGNGYKSISTEHFDNVAELCAAILYRGVSLQLKQGLGRELVYSCCRREQEKGRRMVMLTCHGKLVKMYKRMGFEDHGESESTWGGEKWHEMYCFFKQIRRIIGKFGDIVELQYFTRLIMTYLFHLPFDHFSEVICK